MNNFCHLFLPEFRKKKRKYFCSNSCAYQVSESQQKLLEHSWFYVDESTLFLFSYKHSLNLLNRKKRISNIEYYVYLYSLMVRSHWANCELNEYGMHSESEFSRHIFLEECWQTFTPKWITFEFGYLLTRLKKCGEIQIWCTLE